MAKTVDLLRKNLEGAVLSRQLTLRFWASKKGKINEKNNWVQQKKKKLHRKFYNAYTK